MTMKTNTAPSATRTPAAAGLTRRGFLRGLALAGATAAAAPAAVLAAPSPAAEPLATLLDLSRCIGCGACVEACREKNLSRVPEPVSPIPRMYPARSKPEDWSGKKHVDDRLTPYTRLFIQSAEVEYQGSRLTVHAPRRCLHCENPPCAKLCPFGSARRETNGAVRIDEATCLGGAKCRTVCPWEIPQRQSGVGLYLDLMPGLAGNGVMYKCDRCQDLVAAGKEPACITACPNEAQRIGPRSLIVAEARRLAAERGHFLYGLEENGGTNTIYLSPVPFDLLDAAVAKGPGRPGFASAPEVMKAEANLAGALLAAPLAGLAAGLLKVRSRLGKALDAQKAPAPTEDDHG